MATIADIFKCWKVTLMDKHGFSISNIYVLAPTIHWVHSFFKGELKDDVQIIVEDANLATLDSEHYRKQFNESFNPAGLEKLGDVEKECE